ncbi:MAG: hypothetical protein WAW07_04980 [Bacteroidales bacterium]
MTEKYFIATRPCIRGYHYVHRQGCPFFPEPRRRVPLGVFQSSTEAVIEGRRYFRTADCCPFCLKENIDMNRKTYTVTQSDPDLISSARMKKATWKSLIFCSIS